MPEETVRPPLLGVVIGTLLHQRGHFTLHGSAVSIDGKAVAFIGRKGAGKSTAAALQARGHPLVSDDVLTFDIDEESKVQVQPAFPRIKMNPDSAIALGYDLEALPLLGGHLEKRLLEAVDGFTPHPLPLSEVYLLDAGSELVVRRIKGSRAFAVLMSQTYAPRFLGSAASTPEHFNQCRQIACRVPLYQLTRPIDFSQLKYIATFIESQDSEEG
jgi:hypothetical protein